MTRVPAIDFDAFGALPADLFLKRTDVSCYVGEDFAVTQHLCDYDCYDGCTASPTNPCVDALCEEHWPHPRDENRRLVKCGDPTCQDCGPDEDEAVERRFLDGMNLPDQPTWRESQAVPHPSDCTSCWFDFLTGDATPHAYMAPYVTYEGEDPALYGPNDGPTPCCVVGPGAPDCHECGHVFDGPCCCINADYS